MAFSNLETPCSNFAMCRSTALVELGSTECMLCGPSDNFGMAFGRLDFDSTPAGCPVCLDDDVSPTVRLPQCTHRTCIVCFRDLFLANDTRCYLSPVPYGCPACPNGCKNPTRGRQCQCRAYTHIVRKWGRMNQEYYAVWQSDESESIMSGSVGAYASKRCPMCRAVYTRQ
jgi:hypothetical protein